MINATKHARERYALRIKGIEKSALKANVTMHGSEYEKDLNKMYDNSRLIYTGKFQSYKECKYRLADDIILIIDTDLTKNWKEVRRACLRLVIR